MASGSPARRQRLGGQLLEPVGKRDAEPLGRGAHPREVLLEPERAPAVDTRRLESGAPAQERLVVGEQDGLVHRDEAAPAHRHSEQAQRRTASRSGAPIASSSGRALTSDSSISASGSESQTIPPPTQRWIRSSATANVLIVRARSRSPFG